jgi:RNA polymerase sigma factor (sigma-70 family)
MEIEENTEMRLIRHWRSGDRKAGDKLLRRYEPVLTRFFSRRVNRNVDDLVQRTLLACTQAVERFEGRSSFKTYLLGIAHHQFLVSLRSDRPNLALEARLPAREEDSPSQLLAFREEQVILAKALLAVEPEFAITLKRYYWAGHSVEQIASDLGIPSGTVKSRLSRGRALVKANLLRMKLRAELRGDALRELDAWMKLPEG